MNALLKNECKHLMPSLLCRVCNPLPRYYKPVERSFKRHMRTEVLPAGDVVMASMPKIERYRPKTFK